MGKMIEAVSQIFCAGLVAALAVLALAIVKWGFVDPTPPHSNREADHE